MSAIRHHFRLPDGPVAIQFSGGRTSGMMLHHILDAHDGVLPADCRVLFQNTGREMPETLDFVAECGERWGVEIVWLEFNAEEAFVRVGPGTNRPASMNGEPFEAILVGRNWGMLPSWKNRFCTGDLKVQPSIDYMRWLGHEGFAAALGFRADEKARVDGTLKRDADGKSDPAITSHIFPLHAAGIRKRDVSAFWKAQSFDLRLAGVNGKTPDGNCDGCFLKSERARAHVARYRPAVAEWWNRLEQATGQTFDRRVSWADLIEHVRRQPDWVFDADEGASVYCETGLGGCHD